MVCCEVQEATLRPSGIGPEGMVLLFRFSLLGSTFNLFGHFGLSLFGTQRTCLDFAHVCLGRRSKGFSDLVARGPEQIPILFLRGSFRGRVPSEARIL